jgi:hypothetical protein
MVEHIKPLLSQLVCDVGCISLRYLIDVCSLGSFTDSFVFSRRKDTSVLLREDHNVVI